MNDDQRRSLKQRVIAARAVRQVRAVVRHGQHYVNKYSYRTQPERDALALAVRRGWLRVSRGRRHYIAKAANLPTEAEQEQILEAASDPRWPKPKGGWGS